MSQSVETLHNNLVVRIILRGYYMYIPECVCATEKMNGATHRQCTDQLNGRNNTGKHETEIYT